MKVIIRDLQIKDAEISWKWRNDPEIWKLTGRKWNNHVNVEIEKAWIKDILKQKDSKRFAICVGNKKTYVGNVQLTNINEHDAIFHIFIGNKQYWGKGIGAIATKLLMKYAKKELDIKEIKLSVNKQNLNAINIYKKTGFKITDTIDDDNIIMNFVINN